MKKNLSTLIYAFLAGFCIGLGGTVFLRLKDAFTGGNVIGALLFTVGLFTICTRGYHLFTGKACYLFDNKAAYIPYLILVWIGNLAGGTTLAVMELNTGIGAGLQETARGMIESKMASSPLSLFILGMLCNIFIYIAVNGYAKNPHECGKYLSLFLGVSCFILIGSEHSVADMYYWAVSGILFSQPAASIACLLIISAGNVCGGVLFPLLEKAIGKLEQA